MKWRREIGLSLGTAQNAMQMERILDEKLYWFYNELISSGTNALNSVLLFNVQTFDCVIFKFIVNTFMPFFSVSTKDKHKKFLKELPRFLDFLLSTNFLMNSELLFFLINTKLVTYIEVTSALLFVYLEPEIELHIVRDRNLYTCLWKKNAQKDIFYTRWSEKAQALASFFPSFQHCSRL